MSAPQPLDPADPPDADRLPASAQPAPLEPASAQPLPLEPGSAELPPLEPDSTLRLPQVTVLKASAGSGKTWTLTQRYVQFLLSRRAELGRLPSILAITFSNNATREMKTNVLGWLKRLASGEKDRLEAMVTLVSGKAADLPHRASELLETILDRWSDFRVQTIDSFCATIFMGAALDFGFNPELEIVLGEEELFSLGFDLFLREAGEHGEARAGERHARLLDETIAAILSTQGEEKGFLWDPAPFLRKRLVELEAYLAALDGEPARADLSDERSVLETSIRKVLDTVVDLVSGSALTPSKRSKLEDAVSLARRGAFANLVEMATATLPVTRPKGGDEESAARHSQIEVEWDRFNELLGRYACVMARGHWSPYLTLRAELDQTLEKAKRVRAAVPIADIGRKLWSWLDEGMVPEVYFRLGERIQHYLVDEFQDTSPVQWRCLFPLVENSLAAGGSLFVVGDTKQAIYRFRRADYTIMRRLGHETVFPSAGPPRTRELELNRRSRPRILELASRTFTVNTARDPGYREAARLSGLADYRQRASEAGSDPGHAEISIVARGEGEAPERGKLLEIVAGLHERGWRWGDIAILAMRNRDVVNATGWLDEQRIPFLSLSSLEVRGRGVFAELLCLLAFLDSPPDDLAFASFLLGELFASVLRERHGLGSVELLHRFLFARRGTRPLYKAFQSSFGDLWGEYFATLFRAVGYLPLYDLVCEAISTFRAFEFLPDEEAAFARILEAVKSYEGSGESSLHGFLAYARRGGEGEWDIVVPQGTDAVRAMTVHKAKGLGFPVVILLLYGEQFRGAGCVVERDPGGGFELLHLSSALAGRSEWLRRIYDRERAEDLAERMNKLYVGLTRARHELYVIGVKGERARYPFDILPVDEFPAAGRLAGLSTRRPTPAPAAQHVRLVHQGRPVPPVQTGARLSHAERLRGELVHRALALVGLAEDLDAALLAAAIRAATEKRIASDPAACREAGARLAGKLARALRRMRLTAAFAPLAGRQVHAEWELCDGAGRLYRVDRLVVDPEKVLLIDWKTGSEEIGQPEQETQVLAYLRILSDLFPGRRVDGVLAQLDREELRSVP